MQGWRAGLFEKAGFDPRGRMTEHGLVVGLAAAVAGDSAAAPLFRARFGRYCCAARSDRNRAAPT